MFESEFEKAIYIREIEEYFLKLFSEGKINGTIHTCVGQEFSALAVCNSLSEEDFVISNHRCHGHYLAHKNNPRGLIAELLGKRSGISSGIGSSQHLCDKNFLSNGVQGGMVPVAAGIALAFKLKNQKNICTAFIGDGTLGQGVVYETMNIVSLWKVPLLIVCENNFYALSTPVKESIAGEIKKRAEAFDIKSFEGDTWEYEKLFKTAHIASDYVRESGLPAFLLINTYRLKAHSKGDDTREKEEINHYYEIDPINIFKKNDPTSYEKYFKNARLSIERIVHEVENEEELSIEEYTQSDEFVQNNECIEVSLNKKRHADLIYDFFSESMVKDDRIILMGEDINLPYGGAFKVSKDLSSKFPERVFSTPISEAAIVGIGCGLAISGFRPYIEIMFGDFTTLAFDQIVNNASKFYYMSNRRINCPIVIRTPMGGGKGYGPTHSQSIEKYFLGTGNLKVIILNSFINPTHIYNNILQNENHPVLVIENKSIYSKKYWHPQISGYSIKQMGELYPTIVVMPNRAKPNLTIVTFGGIADAVVEAIPELISELEIIPAIFIISKVSPINTDIFLESVIKTKNLVTIEEGSVTSGIGSEIIARVAEINANYFQSLRIGSQDFPIPSVGGLESQILPTKKTILKLIQEKFYEQLFHNKIAT